MKTNYRLVLAVLTGFAIGIAAVKATHAGQVTPPPAYVISEVDAMDLAGIKKYGEKVGDTLAPFNGHYHFLVGGSAKVQALDGEPPKGIVVLAFDSAEKARQWYDSPDYEAIKPIRLSATKGRMFIVEGLASQ